MPPWPRLLRGVWGKLVSRVGGLLWQAKRREGSGSADGQLGVHCAAPHLL